VPEPLVAVPGRAARAARPEQPPPPREARPAPSRPEDRHEPTPARPHTPRPHPGLRPAEHPFTRGEPADPRLGSAPLSPRAAWPGDDRSAPQPAPHAVQAHRAAVERPAPTVHGVEPRLEAAPRAPRVAPERRIRFVEMPVAAPSAAGPEPEASRSGLRAVASLAAVLVVAAGAGAGWIWSGGTLSLPVDLTIDLPLDTVASNEPARTDLPLRAAEAPSAAPAGDALVPEPDAAAELLPPSSDAAPSAPEAPVLSSDLISDMKISRPTPVEGAAGPEPELAAPPPAVDEAAPPVVAAAPAEPAPPIVAPAPADPASPDVAAPIAPTGDGTSPDPLVATAPPVEATPDPASATLADDATASDPNRLFEPGAAPIEDAIAAILAAPGEPPRPRVRPSAPPDAAADVATLTRAPDGIEAPAGALAPPPDLAPTGTLPPNDAVETTPASPATVSGATAGRVIVGRIIPPEEMAARARTDRPIVGRIIPPEEFVPGGRAGVDGRVPPRDVGVLPFVSNDPGFDDFDTRTDSITTTPPATATGGRDTDPEGGSSSVAGDLRVVLHVPREEAVALDGAVDAAVATMPGRVEVKVVDVHPEGTMVRYYYPEDRAAAEAVRQRLSGEAAGPDAVGISDFTAYRPLPRKGLIEVWLAETP
jgi:hypothetical protein